MFDRDGKTFTAVSFQKTVCGFEYDAFLRLWTNTAELTDN